MMNSCLQTLRISSRLIKEPNCKFSTQWTSKGLDTFPFCLNTAWFFNGRTFQLSGANREHCCLAGEKASHLFFSYILVPPWENSKRYPREYFQGYEHIQSVGHGPMRYRLQTASLDFRIYRDGNMKEIVLQARRYLSVYFEGVSK
jgi:hypothetical protein